MIVTGITSVTKQKYKIELDGQPAFVLYKGELARYHIKIEEYLSTEQYDEIVDEVLTKRAKKYVLHLLTKMDRTKKEIESKLISGGYPQKAIESAISYVEGYHYLNDEQYARNYIQVSQNRLSNKQISWKLMEKGIDREIVVHIMEEVDLRDETQLIHHYIEKKVGKKVQISQEEIRKTAAYLYRRGFENCAIWDALKQYQEETIM
jgi:regulatory protein